MSFLHQEQFTSHLHEISLNIPTQYHQFFTSGTVFTHFCKMSLNITTQRCQFFTSGTVFYRKRKSLSANPLPQQEEQFFASGTKETVFCIRNNLLHILAKRQRIFQSKNTSFLHQEQFYHKKES